MALTGPLVDANAGVALWAVLAAAAAAGQVLENRTRWGASVSAPLLTMGVMIALSWFGVIPAASPTYELVWSKIMPLAVCLYLLETDVRKVFSDAGTTFKAFVLGAVGTIIGTIIAFACVGRWMGPDGWKIASCLCASYVGGSINYAATAQALGLASGGALAAGMAADNLAMAAYFGVLMSWPTEDELRPTVAGSASNPSESGEKVSEPAEESAKSTGSMFATLADIPMKLFTPDVDAIKSDVLLAHVALSGISDGLQTDGWMGRDSPGPYETPADERLDRADFLDGTLPESNSELATARREHLGGESTSGRGGGNGHLSQSGRGPATEQRGYSHRRSSQANGSPLWASSAEDGGGVKTLVAATAGISFRNASRETVKLDEARDFRMSTATSEQVLGSGPSKDNDSESKNGEAFTTGREESARAESTSVRLLIATNMGEMLSPGFGRSAGVEKTGSGVESRSPVVNSMVFGVERISTGVKELGSGVEEPSTDFDGLSTGVEERARPTSESVSLSLAAAACSCYLGQALASALPPAFAGTELAWMAVIASLITIAVGHMSSGRKPGGPHIEAFAGAETIGGALMQVFFAVVGATASLQEAVTGGWPLLIFILLLLTVHVAFIAVLGSKVFKLPIRSVLIASNANVGGPATAAAMASAKGWPEMVRGALLTGTLGYTVGTAIGCLVGILLHGI